MGGRVEFLNDITWLAHSLGARRVAPDTGWDWYQRKDDPYSTVSVQKILRARSRPSDIVVDQDVQVVIDVAPAADPIEAEFSHHLRRWREDTRYLSSTTAKLVHPSYLRIIALGPRVIPFILRDLRKNGGLWFTALEALTNVDVSAGVEEGNVKRLTERWLAWGRQNGYLTEG